MTYELPTSVVVAGVEYEVRSDYRPILDICMAISDAELSDQERAEAVLDIFYPAFEELPQRDYGEAIEKCFWFINCGDAGENRKAPKLMDWEQDFQYIVAPVNRVVGSEIRSMPYLHWWSFVAAYYEIGDCLFAQIVRIRSKKASGKALDKSDRDWYAKNRALVDLKVKYTDAEDTLLKQWAKG